MQAKFLCVHLTCQRVFSVLNLYRRFGKQLFFLIERVFLMIFRKLLNYLTCWYLTPMIFIYFGTENLKISVSNGV